TGSASGSSDRRVSPLPSRHPTPRPQPSPPTATRGSTDRSSSRRTDEHNDEKGGARMSPADWASKDFYQVLGVSKDATADEIKKSYRKLARTNHPDSNPGDQAAEERFKEISEAYSVLSDPDKRKEYDEQRAFFSSGGYATGGGQGGF